MPAVEVLGVYSIPVTKELVKQQTDLLHGSELTGSGRRDAERECRQQLESTVLLEVLVRDRDQRFKTGDFRQRDQVAYSERYLTLDGESIVETRWPDVPESKDLRIAFFLHFWTPKSALMTSYGSVTCPTPQKMPDRLAKLVPYPLLD